MTNEEALKIKEVYSEQPDDECENCPFYDRSDGCLFKESSRNCWEIAEYLKTKNC